MAFLVPRVLAASTPSLFLPWSCSARPAFIPTDRTDSSTNQCMSTSSDRSLPCQPSPSAHHVSSPPPCHPSSSSHTPSFPTSSFRRPGFYSQWAPAHEPDDSPRERTKRTNSRPVHDMILPRKSVRVIVRVHLTIYWTLFSLHPASIRPKFLQIHVRGYMQ